MTATIGRVPSAWWTTTMAIRSLAFAVAISCTAAATGSCWLTQTTMSCCVLPAAGVQTSQQSLGSSEPLCPLLLAGVLPGTPQPCTSASSSVRTTAQVAMPLMSQSTRHDQQPDLHTTDQTRRLPNSPSCCRRLPALPASTPQHLNAPTHPTRTRLGMISTCLHHGPCQEHHQHYHGGLRASVRAASMMLALPIRPTTWPAPSCQEADSASLWTLAPGRTCGV